MRLSAALLLCLLPGTAAAQAVPTSPEQPGQPDVSRVEAGTYAVDTAHTQVSWRVNHIGVSTLQGMFPPSGGSITIDPAKLADTKLDLTFAIDEMSVTQPAFAEHLKSSDFFDSAVFPTARFVSTAVTPRDGNKATLTGDLTIRDQTRPVTIEAAFVGAGLNPLSKRLNIGFEGRATLKRSDFGVAMAAPAVSDEVVVDLNAVFTAP